MAPPPDSPLLHRVPSYAVSVSLSPLICFRAHKVPVTYVAAGQLGHGRTVASGDISGEVLVWDADTAVKRASLSLKVRSVGWVLMSLPLWPFTLCAPPPQKRGLARPEGVSCIRLTPSFLVAGGDDGTVAAWSFMASARGCGPQAKLVPQLVFRQATDLDVVRVLSVAPNANLVAAGGHNGKAKVWLCYAAKAAAPSASPFALRASKPFSRVTGKALKGHTTRVTTLLCSATHVVSSSLDGTVKVWDVMDNHLGRCLRSLRVPDEGVRAVAAWGDQLFCGTVAGRTIKYHFTRPDSAATTSVAAAVAGNTTPSSVGSASSSRISSKGTSRKSQARRWQVDDDLTYDPSEFGPYELQL